ncbi:NAD(P)/FAD-dependent oxidoreductase [Nocardioides aestuarii]|uniref:NAD(P)/FAD-dependent oxidoreductase n=1 Tax=Nocardioides aestuarii TaxID=252231 RepID=A0ABW4TSA7_9ACTN
MTSDLLVVGARCAGAATAMLAARAGYDVVLVDRAAVPTDTTSTHGLVRGGMVLLDRWGLLDAVLASGAPAVRQVDFHRHDATGVRSTSHRVRARAGVDFLLAPRRRELDRLLVEAAVAAGARLLDRTTVDRAVVEDGRVRGVTARAADGSRHEMRARLVVGADGRDSRVARLVSAPLTQSHANGGACFYTYVAGVPWQGFEMHVSRRRFAGVFPTHGGEAAVFLTLPTADASDLVRAGARRTEVWRGLMRQAAPGLADRVDAGVVTAPLRGTVSLPHHVRQAGGPGWALVGDAGYHRDPITSHGMTDAFRDAELLTAAVGRLLNDPAEESAALAEYGERRDAMLARTYALTRELSAFPDPDRFLALQAELAKALDAEALELAGLPVATARNAAAT